MKRGEEKNKETEKEKVKKHLTFKKIMCVHLV
jgi:hypothetical protein